MSASSLLRTIATLGFIGYLPFAPGTFGSLVAMVFFVIVKPSPTVHALLVVAITLAGTIASHHAEKLLKEKDSRHIIIDEFAGYALSVIFLPAALPYFIAAFLLFRFFDILKPPPIRWIERILPGGIAVMADDLMAGIYTNALLQIWIRLA
ncbi:MAG TPA: phosphatidylglycerophosphatase A [Thermodesulfovibrionales bacterium]|nr:phosphatidylglycerophosphatase A [Thermodesulfovibrionales bacterium]